LTDLYERTGLMRVPAATVLARARGLPRSTWGTAFAHFALGITLIGIVGETQWGVERVVSLKPTQTVSLRGYDLTFDALVPRQGPNYREQVARFTVRRDGQVLGVLESSKRAFTAQNRVRTEAALMTRGLSQLYVSLGDPGTDGSVAVRVYHKPLVLLIWLGVVVMVFGGALSLTDRRLRVGAPKPAKAKAAMQPAE